MERHRLDGRTRLAQVLKRLVEMLLEGHGEPVPGPVQVLAQRCAFKLVRASLYESAMLAGGEVFDDGRDHLYLALTNSIRSDICALHQMRQVPEEKPPTLADYLNRLKNASGGVCIVPLQREEKGDQPD